MHAFVLSIMNVNLLFLLFIVIIYFILICSVHFSAFVANKDIYYYYRRYNYYGS